MNSKTHTIRYSVVGFPGCCGIKAIVGLSVVATGNKWPKVNWEKVCDDHNNNTLIATTTEDQVSVNKILEEDGWVKQKLPANPNSGNVLYLWTYTKQTLIEYQESEPDYDDEDEDYDEDDRET